MSLSLDETYQAKDFTLRKLQAKEFDNCTFIDCKFQEAHLSHLSFLECTFINCNLTNTHWGGTTLNEVTFENCKLLGSDFGVCNPFMLSLRFCKSNLSLAIFHALDLKGTTFDQCILKDTNFTNTILSSASFDHSDLTGATFENTSLEKANFLTALNYTIDPTKNKIKDARFAVQGVPGLLSHLGIVIEK